MPSDRNERLELVLESLAENEKKFSERFYQLFFERRPDTLVLFGAYSIAEQEEMMAETLRSLFALYSNEPWLEHNLRALGRSHAEYGVESEMYVSFVEVFVECGREVLGADLDAGREKVLTDSLTKICEIMSRAGDSDLAGARSS